MTSFFCVGKGLKVVEGGWQQVANRAIHHLKENPEAILKIYQGRGGEKFAVVVAEITSDGIRQIYGGNRAKVSDLLRKKS